MYYTFENFISYHNDYEIATEGFSFSELKSKIVKIFIKLVNLIESGVRKMKDGKIKATLMKLLGRAKAGLSKSKSLNEHDKELAQELSQEAKVIREEYDSAYKAGEQVKDFNSKNKFKNTLDRFLIKSEDELTNRNNIKQLRNIIAREIFTNKYFSINDFENAIKYVESKGVKLREDTLQGDLISSKIRGDVTDKDLANATMKLSENFCDERINDVKIIYNKLHERKTNNSKNKTIDLGEDFTAKYDSPDI